MRVDLELLKLRASTGVDRDVLELLFGESSARVGEWESCPGVVVRRDFFSKIFFSNFFLKFFGIEVGRGFDGP